jgi:hypothetical protein
MPKGTSSAHRLADVLLTQPLAGYVADKRASTPQWSWRQIANRLARDTNGQVQVTGETLRLWFREDVAA